MVRNFSLNDKDPVIRAFLHGKQGRSEGGIGGGGG